MIRSIDLRVVFHINYVLINSFAYNKIINSPTNVSSSAIREVRPIGVALSFLGILLAIDINESRLKQTGKVFLKQGLKVLNIVCIIW